MATNKVLTIDINNDSITIVEETPAKNKQSFVHNVMIFDTPEAAFEDGFVQDKDRVGAAIREQLNANGISNKNAIFVLTSTKIVSREVVIPLVKENKIAGIINANASEYFPVNIEDYVISHSVLENTVDEEGNKSLRVLVVAVPQQMIRTYYDVASVAGLNVQSMDYMGNAMLQLIKTQTVNNATTMVVQIGNESTILNIVKGDTLLLQRTVPYGVNAVVAEVMEEKEVDAATALSMLQNERMITVDFDDDAITGSFRYLINNIGRVMDYYASKNPDKPIDDVYLTGDGALIRGIDGLFKIQLNVTTKVMDSLYNVKFDDKINTQVYNPVYLVGPIGAGLDPMGFVLREEAAKKASQGQIAIFIVLLILSAIIAVGATVFGYMKKINEQRKLRNVNNQIAAIQDIQDIYQNYLDEQAKYNDMANMYNSTMIANEHMLEFIETMEKVQPKNVSVKDMTSNSNGVELTLTSSDRDSIARYIVELKKIDFVQEAYIGTISQLHNEESGDLTYEYDVTFVYSAPEIEQVITDAGIGEAAPEEGASEEATEAGSDDVIE